VEVALATRPDCMSRDYATAIADLVADKAPETNMNLELGLQSVNCHTLKNINRGHTLAEFIDTVNIAQEYDFDVGVHLILNLPGDDVLDVIESAKVVSALGVDNVKLHALYIREDTELGRQYQNNELEMISLGEYIERVITFLEHLDPEIGVQRLLGKAPQEGTLFVNWGYNYSEVNNLILQEMEDRDSQQGDKFDYLDGKALSKFE
ncbi:MAG: radical SAM protein, partial [Bacillota bacterium]